MIAVPIIRLFLLFPVHQFLLVLLPYCLLFLLYLQLGVMMILVAHLMVVLVIGQLMHQLPHLQ
jgi:hypothetical protein